MVLAFAFVDKILKCEHYFKMKTTVLIGASLQTSVGLLEAMFSKCDT